MGRESFGVPGAPDDELSRSPAAARVGRLASASGLLLANFEHRVALPLPPAWTGAAEPIAGWHRGVLAEGKYTHFRHDDAVGSFHPGHRAKWTAHELAHRLCGFAWKPGATLFFHALAARLSEALPVTLWYFFDEAGLARCPDHAGQGPLFGTHCGPCDSAARAGAAPEGEAAAQRWWAEGRAFLDRELDAIRRSRAQGTPVVHRHATLDLSTDGTAWAAAHGPRLGTPEMAEHVERFHEGRGLWHPTLDALEARVREVAEALAGGAPAAPLRGTRDAWIAQDLGWRLIQVRAETEGEATGALTALVDRLSTSPGPETFLAVQAGYRALFDDWILPEPDDVFAVGYDLPGGAGRSVRQVHEGLSTVCPGALHLLGDEASSLVAGFVGDDAPVRRPLGRRFSGWLAARRPGPVAELAALEAALAQPPAGDPRLGLGCAGARDGRRRWTRGLELLRCEVDVVALADAISAGRRPNPRKRKHNLVVGRAADGEVVLAEVTDAAAEALLTGDDHAALPGGEVADLEAAGLLLPIAWDA